MSFFYIHDSCDRKNIASRFYFVFFGLLVYASLEQGVPANRRRERYPEGVWEAASSCASDDPDEIADKGIELVKACSDLVGEKDTLYFLRSLIKGNKSKYEKQSGLLEFVSGLEEIEVGEWFSQLHYADDITSAIKVGIAYLGNGVKE